MGDGGGSALPLSHQVVLLPLLHPAHVVVDARLARVVRHHCFLERERDRRRGLVVSDVSCRNIFWHILLHSARELSCKSRAAGTQ